MISENADEKFLRFWKRTFQGAQQLIERLITFKFYYHNFIKL